MIKNKITLQETETEIIVRIPKASVAISPKSPAEAEVLKIIAQAETEFKEGKAKTFRSIKKLLSSNHGR